MKPDQDGSDAGMRVKLALLSAAARDGASDDGLGALTAALAGEKLVGFDEHPSGEAVQVKVSRVHGIGDYYKDDREHEPDCCVLYFTRGPHDVTTPKLVVDVPQNKAVRRLREAGWPY